MDLVTKQREERKERILEVARRLMAERGYEGVTMRELADESLVSVPTLYNLFGGKNELLFAAIESYLVELLRGSEAAPEAEPGLARVIALARHLATRTLDHASYARSLMGFFGTSPQAAGLNQFVAGELVRALVIGLEEMRARDELVDWIDVQVLGERLAGSFIITSFDWAHHSLTDEALGAALYYAVGISLLGLARGPAVEALEGLVREHQDAARSVASLTGDAGKVAGEVPLEPS